MARQMTLVGFLQAQNCTNFVGSWRHPLADQDFTSAEYYRRIGRALEGERKIPISASSTTDWRCRTCSAAITPTPSPTASAA